MSRLPNLTHVNRKGEQKALWNGRKTHICVRWRGGKNRAAEKKRKKKQKKKQISKPPQHMETGSEKEEVLTGCPCGGSCLSTGLEDGGVSVCVRACAHVRMCVCTCVHACVCATHMDVDTK